MEDTREVLYHLLSEVISIDTEALSDTMNFEKDIELDSILLMEYLISIEDHFGVDITEFSEVSHNMNTLGEMLDYLQLLIKRGDADGTKREDSTTCI